MASKVKTLNHLLTAWDDTKLRVAEDQQQNALVLIILIGHYLFIHMSFQNCIVLFFCVHLVITLERTERLDKYGLRLNVFDSCSRQESCCVCLLPGCVLMSAGALCAGMGGKKKKKMMYLTTKNAGKDDCSICPVQRMRMCHTLDLGCACCCCWSQFYKFVSC